MNSNQISRKFNDIRENSDRYKRNGETKSSNALLFRPVRFPIPNRRHVEKAKSINLL